jgi:hypothetical protein
VEAVSSSVSFVTVDQSTVPRPRALENSSILEGEPQILQSTISKHEYKNIFMMVLVNNFAALLTVEDRTDRSSQNVCNQLATYAMFCPRRAEASVLK